MIKFLLFSGFAYMFIKPAIQVYLDNQRREEERYLQAVRARHGYDPFSPLSGVQLSNLIQESYDKLMEIQASMCECGKLNCPICSEVGK